MFVILFCVSFSQGGSILVGRLIGQQKQQEAYELGNYIFRLSLMVTLTISGVLALMGKTILDVFTNNEEIIALGCGVLIIDFLAEIGRCCNIFAVGTLRATGDVFYPIVIGIIFQWTVAVGLSYFLGISLGYGLMGIWFCFALDENIRGVILLRRWRSGKWKGKGFVKT